MKSLDIRFVLVEPSHPGNIGAVARALKNMALSQLWLVRPRQFPHAESLARASGADDVLNQAQVVGTVDEALQGCGFVVATTARPREHNHRVLDVRAAADRMVQEAQRSPVAVLLGPERTGLTNAELDLAHLLLRIPGNPEYLSLNVAMAAQIVAYELFQARNTGANVPLSVEPAVPLATPQQMTQFYAHLSQVMSEVDFRDRTQSGTQLMQRIRRFMQRAELDQNEVNILRGFLTCVQGRRRKAGL